MIIDSIKKLFIRDLNKLRHEIDLYENEDVLWRIENSIQNSGGNLCLHLIGNLKTYIGDGLANVPYVRQREFEFSGKNINKNELIKGIEETILLVEKGLNSVSDDQLKDKFPVRIWEEDTEMGFTIMHLHSHLNYHLGQINYHRRILDMV